MKKMYYNSTNNFADISPDSIWKSGLCYKLYSIEKQQGHLGKEDYIKVTQQYGTSDSANIRQIYKLYKEAFWSQ